MIDHHDFDEPGGMLRVYLAQSHDLRRSPSAELRVHLRGRETCIDCDMPPRACRCETVLRCSCGIPASVCVCAG